MAQAQNNELAEAIGALAKTQVERRRVEREQALSEKATDGKIAQAATKVPLAMVPQQALIGTARIFGYGAKKYAPGNWYGANLADGAGERYISAAFRHLVAMQGPDGLYTTDTLGQRDDESGLPHLDHAICSLIMLRGILVKNGALPADPGLGNEPPPTKTSTGRKE